MWDWYGDYPDTSEFHLCSEHRVLISFYEYGPLARYACKVCDQELSPPFYTE